MYCEKGRSVIKAILIAEPQKMGKQLNDFYFFWNDLGFKECGFF